MYKNYELNENSDFLFRQMGVMFNLPTILPIKERPRRSQMQRAARRAQNRHQVRNFWKHLFFFLQVKSLKKLFSILNHLTITRICPFNFKVSNFFLGLISFSAASATWSRITPQDFIDTLTKSTRLVWLLTIMQRIQISLI